MAHVNSSSVTTGCLPPTSSIKRILVTHMNLYASCENGKSLGDNASLAEISEEILFYHRGSQLGFEVGEDEEWNLTPANSSGSCLEEAVSFLGLCKALYTLPNSLVIPHPTGSHDYGSDDSGVDSEHDSEHDRTNSVYFGNSILVFVPLESTLDIIAVVEVSRMYQNGIKSDTGSANPLAISASIKRTHRLFCILRGGGIIHRLDETRYLKKAANDGLQRPGMKKLFSLLREIRESKDSLSRHRCSSISDKSREDAIQHIAELEQKVESCRQSLPIQSLRRDLESHYNEYLNCFFEVSIRNGGAGRCVVEMMPVPVANDSGSHIYHVPPSKIERRSLESLEDSLLRVLQSHSSCSLDPKDSNLSLLGIAIFESSRLLRSFSNSEKLDLSNDTVSLLMAYMASYRAKMRHATASIARTALVSPSSLPGPQMGLLKRLAFHIGPMVDKSPNQTEMLKKRDDADASNNLTHQILQHRGRFLPLPPSFMLDASDQLFSLSYDDNKDDIWAPRVNLSLAPGFECSRNKDVITNDRFATHMVVFEFLQFSFLIFINLPLQDHLGFSETPESRFLLLDLEAKLSEAIIHAFCDESCVWAFPESMSAHCTKEPGQDIVAVEESKGVMVLISDPKLRPPQRDSKKKTSTGNKTKNQMRRFRGFSPRNIENVSQLHRKSERSTTVEWSALGLDCRHILASRLSLDICLAFDDMINEVRKIKSTTMPSLCQKKRNGDELCSTLLELCTYTPSGWIYALATKTKEIYVLFDCSIYVTVADVQSAVLRIKERYIEKTI